MVWLDGRSVCVREPESLLVLQRENAVDYHLHESAKGPRSNRQDKTPRKMPGTHHCQFASAPEPLRRLRF